MTTGLILIAGGSTITKIMDLIGNTMAEKYRRSIPYIAMLLGISRMLMSPELPLREVLSQGVSIGLASVGIHVITKRKEDKKSVKETIKENNTKDLTSKSIEDESYVI